MYMILFFVFVLNDAFGTKVLENCDTETTKPIKCGLNEKYVKCRTKCPPQSCNIAYTDYACLPESKICEPGCDCIKDHLRNASNICVPNDQCSYTPKPTCGDNEVYSDCKRVCPPQTCESLGKAYICDGPSLPPCDPGCNCIDGYYRNANNICVSEKECRSGKSCSDNTSQSESSSSSSSSSSGSSSSASASSSSSASSGSIKKPCPKPKCGPHEVFSQCKIDCPPQSCESIYRSYKCDDGRKCVSGCDCIDGYLRDSNNTCIPNELCPPAPTLPTKPRCGKHEVYTKCKIVCPPQTCAGLYIKIACIKDPPCESGCDCIDGYRRDKNNKCIPTNQCPGISNTLCGVNETLSDCAFRCPNQNCPADDSLIQVACKPGRPCVSGCMCKDGYRRLSEDDDTCVLASDCPPVECTRPNEVWDSCSSECLDERCDKDDEQTRNCESSSCQPRCVCKKNFCRDKENNCVPSNKCGNSNFCEPTCAVPNPPNCQSITRNKSGKIGSCQDGYILSKRGGKCIKIEDCPKGCNGDKNAVTRACPSPCPSTCDSPNESPCKRKCDPLGCECDYGYILSENGKCIEPTECPGGNPCRKNEIFVACKNGCPTDYCPQDDSRAIVACDPVPYPYCLSGCVCRLNHKKLSHDDQRCIVSSECPPVKCTRPNEEWNPCPSECQGEYCDSANKEPVTCNTLVLNCRPQCTCKKGFFRNSNDTCIPEKECPCPITQNE